MSNVYVVKKISKKEGRQDLTYIQMYVDLGYRKVNLSFDVATIVELTTIPYACLYQMNEDEPMKVAEFNLKGE